jgi:hypothetical protein
LAPLLLVLAAVALGHALQIANGFYDPVALVWLTAALVLCAVGVLSLKSSGVPSRGKRFAIPVAIAPGVPRAAMTMGIAWQLVSLLISSPGLYLDASVSMLPFKTGVVLEGALIALGIGQVRVFRRWWFPALLAVHLLLGAWMIHASPSPRIDVVVVHRAAIRALLHGHDPYGITFRNIYGADSPFYNPQALVGNRVNFGYPYPPVSLLLAVPGQVLAGDYRYAELAALILGAAVIGYVRPAVTARLAASLLLTTPRVFFVLEQGWAEPITVMMLALTVFCLVRRPGLVPWAGGLLLVTKQYLVVAAPPLLRFAGRGRAEWGRFLGQAALAALVVTLPFALWHPGAFIDDVVWLQTRELFRIDALSYLSLAARAGWGAGSLVWSVVAALVALVIAMIRTPNTPAGFAGSIALSSLAMFAWGSKAFCNYYFFVIAAICCTIAIVPVTGEAVESSPDLRVADSPLGGPLPL